jgi:hypothetical protein
MKKVTGFAAKAPDAAGPRGYVAHAKAAFHCSGAWADSRDYHEVAAGTPYFRFTKDFYFLGVLYARTARVCMEHAIRMGVVEEVK